MTSILFFIAGIALGFYIGGKTKKQTIGNFASKEPEEMQEIRKEAQEALTERTEKRKEKILDFMNLDATHEEELKACGVTDIKKGITSLNVEKLLDVSDRTARKYLNELENEGKNKQIGERGPNVYYIPLPPHQ